MNLFAERNTRIDTENAFKVGPHIVRVEKNINPVIKLNLGEPDFSVPQHIKEEIKRQLDLDNTHYCDPKGILSLRNAISNQINETRRLNTNPEQVVVFPGGKPSIGMAQQVYCEPGDEVIYPSPGFPIYESFIRYVRAVPVPLHLKEESNFTFSAEELANLITPKLSLLAYAKIKGSLEFFNLVSINFKIKLLLFSMPSEFIKSSKNKQKHNILSKFLFPKISL